MLGSFKPIHQSHSLAVTCTAFTGWKIPGTIWSSIYQQVRQATGYILGHAK
jgi:hypothetical protein